jgi:hypothetical protein
MIEINWKPSDKMLRQFGFGCLVMLPLVGWLLHRRVGLPTEAVWGLAGAGVLLFAAGLTIPKVLWPFYVVLTAVGFPIGWLISHLVMMVFYFGILTPIGLFFRLMGRDVLHRRWDPKADSYWVRCSRPDSVKRYFRQF